MSLAILCVQCLQGQTGQAILCVQCLQRQTGQPPTAILALNIGETTDDVKRRTIRELDKILEGLEPKLSRISDEEIVRIIREDREGCRSGDA